MSETLEPALVFRCSEESLFERVVQKFRGLRQSQPSLLACALWGESRCQEMPGLSSHAQRQRPTTYQKWNSLPRRIGEIKHRQLPRFIPARPSFIQLLAQL